MLVGTVSTEFSDSVPEGIIIGQDPASGTSVLPGSSVDLLVSLGLESTNFTLPENVSLEMLSIPAGTFMMGSASTNQLNEEPVHQISISRGFQLGRFEVTKAQWEAVTGTAPWSGLANVQDDPDTPATHISWNDAQAFIADLNSLTGETFRLPSEAEWEYACRAGTTTEYYFGDSSSSLSDYAWWNEKTLLAGERYAHDVGQLLPNAFGLFDMLGNVWEWCEDRYISSYYLSSPTTNPPGPLSGSNRVVRGNSWVDDDCRSAQRDWHVPTLTDSIIGFRLARGEGTTFILPCDTPLTMTEIPAGTFMMGSTNGPLDEIPVHEVTIA